MDKKSKTILGLSLLSSATTVSYDQYAKAVKEEAEELLFKDRKSRSKGYSGEEERIREILVANNTTLEEEYNLIMDKKSKLSRKEREYILNYVNSL